MKRIALSVFLCASMLCAADVTGHWSGTFDFKTQEGDQRQAPVYLVLKQDGAKVTGTGGGNLQEQHPIKDGKIAGDKVIFDVDAGERVAHLELKLDEDQLKGEATTTRGDGSKMTGKISTKRVKDGK